MSKVKHTPITWHDYDHPRLSPCYRAKLGKWTATMGWAWGIWSVRVENWKQGETQLGYFLEEEARKCAEDKLRWHHNQSQDTSLRVNAK